MTEFVCGRAGESKFEILLVEDNPGDVRLAREALRETGASATLKVTHDGVEALAYLRKEAPFKSAKRPDLILLDLNLPRKNGREVLREIKESTELQQIPVIILTTSNAGQDIRETYRLRANSFITKPVDFEQFLTVMRSVQEFWFGTATLPPK